MSERSKLGFVAKTTDFWRFQNFAQKKGCETNHTLHNDAICCLFFLGTVQRYRFKNGV